MRRAIYKTMGEPEITFCLITINYTAREWAPLILEEGREYDV
jgi:hypothetical protein